MINPNRTIIGGRRRHSLKIVLVLACVTAFSLSCGGEEPTANDDPAPPSEFFNLGGIWDFQGYDIESNRFTCLPVGLALDLNYRITNFDGTASGMGTACDDKLGLITWNLNIGPLGSSYVEGTQSNGVVKFVIPADGARVSSVIWRNEGTVEGDSLVGELSITFTVSDGWTDPTRHSVEGKWKATRR